MPQSYTIEDLQKMGAQPKAFTIDELQSMGAKPVAETGAGSLAYRQETARQTFNANQPIPTAATGLQNLGESAVESGKSILQGLTRNVGASPLGVVPIGGRPPALSLMDAVKGAYHGIVDPVLNYGSKLLAGDPDAAAREGGKILTQTVPAVYGATELGARAIPSSDALMAGAADARNAVRNIQPTVNEITGVRSSPSVTAAIVRTAARPVVNAGASLAEAVAKFKAGKPTDLASAIAEHQPVGDIVSPANPAVVAADEASRIRQAGPAPNATPVAQPPIAAPRPAVPSFIDQQLAEARTQAAHENFPSGEIKPRADLSNGPIEPPPSLKQAMEQSQARTATPEQMQRIIKPTSTRADSTIRLTDSAAANGRPLLQDVVPELAGMRPGLLADSVLKKAYDGVVADVIQKENAVPRTTVIAKAPIVEGLNALAQEYSGKGLEAISSKLAGEAEAWGQLPDNISWDDFLGRKRSFFQDNNLKSNPMRRAYGLLMDAAKVAGPDMELANSRYATVRQAIDNANMNLKTGQRRGAVGKEPKPTALEKSTMEARRLPPL